MAEDEKRCTLSKSARCCMMEYAGDEACTHCGWQPEERARRKALPLTEDENGIRRKTCRNGGSYRWLKSCNILP